ncbi:histone acetyltransferase p300-like [Diadema antillarum]|uniref:histone acetyltransferase p300-like n=1 Tax=Diadema antillarum TaxID=105358 RepID=UPI003A8527BC
MASGSPNVSVNSIIQEPITEVTNTILEGITALLTAESQPNCTATSPKAACQPWHAFISSDLRIHLACKLVQAIFPSPNQEALRDRRMTVLLNVASQMENDIFEQASSREEYYHLLGEKIYKIQTVLKEERQRHLAEDQASIFPAGTPSNSAPNASIDSIGQGPESEEINGVPEELTALLTTENLPNYTALPSTAASQPWHANISLEHRTHLVHKL